MPAIPTETPVIPTQTAPVAPPAPVVDPNAVALAAAAALVTAAPPSPVVTQTPAAATPTVPEPTPAVAPVVTQPSTQAATPPNDDAFAMGAAPRGLEDSFAQPAVAALPTASEPIKVAPVTEAITTPAALPAIPEAAVAKPVVEVPPAVAANPMTAEPVAVAPVVEAVAAPQPAPAAVGPTDFLQDNPFVASAPATTASRPPENALRRRVNKPERQRPLPPRPARAEASAPEAASSTTPAAVPVAAVAPLPPKPTRQVTPRDFAAATVVASAPASGSSAPAAALNLAPEIPVDTRPLDRVDEELIASGIIAGPEGDTLTSQVPTSLAVAETPFPNASFADQATQDFSMPPPLPSSPGFTLATAPHSQTPAGPLPAGFGPTAPGAWEVDLGSPTPPPDIFKPQAAVSSLPAGFETATPGRVPPPTLPEGRPSRAQLAAAGRTGTSWAGIAVAAAALGGVGLFVWHQATQPGGLENVSAQMAKLTQPRANQPTPNPASDPSLLPPPSQLAGQGGPVGNARIEFAAPLADPNQPIAATGNEPMPEDISVFAKLQREIQAARAEREGAAVPGTSVAGTPATTTAPTAPLTKEQTDKTLEEYRQLLADSDPATAPKPREFLRDPDAFMDGSNNQPVADASGALLPPPASRGENAGRPSTASLPPPNELYTNNPNGLPIVAEPQMQEAPRIRQLQDFASELFPPETSKVKIPQGVRPQMAATDFPSLEVLSFVPGRGLIASTNGREGVLMVGESINGWQLTGVASDMAEFRAGERSYILTAQN